MTIFFVAVAALLMAACANMGRPQGGLRDEVPPEFVRSNPAPGSRNVSPSRVEAWFDENIQLEDAFNKVIVSPTQKTSPVVRSLGKRVYVELRDTLLENTTYTIDFADAIKDLNEGNILDGFALDFSTGPDLDTLRISGIVLDARTLEPAQGMTVGIYTDPADTAITTLPFERIARTNQYGQFTVRNLKPGRYAVYALNDVNRDNRWDRSEDVAFLGTLVEPYAEAIEVSDTLRNADGLDSIATRAGVAFYPNDVLLTWFNENYRAQYLRDHARPERRKITIGMGAPSDSLPTLRVVGGAFDGEDIADHALLQRNATNDSLTYWLRNPDLIAVDSLMLSVRHELTDSLSQITWATDTIRFFWREPKKKEEKKKKDAESDTIPEPTPLISLKVTTPSAHEIYSPLLLQSTTPVESVDSAGVHLEIMPDSVWLPAKLLGVQPDPQDPVLGLRIDFDRLPGQRYRLTVDSASVNDIYGLHNGPITHEFTVKNPEDYSNLVFNLTNVDSTAVVELLNGSDEPVMVAAAGVGHRAKFANITPGTYYARLFLDANGNGKWDTGSIADSLQAEEVYYYAKKLELKANWDIEQAWDIFELPLDAQKPYAIKKNKPKLKKGEKEPGADEVLYDEWGDPIDPNDPRYRNGSGGTTNTSNPFGNFGGGIGGFQQNTGGTLRPRL